MTDLSLSEYQALAEFRYQIRRFLHFSEQQARDVGLEPQQHQLLLAVRGLPPDQRPTIGILAGRMQLKQHSMVELVDRLEKRGLLRRTRMADDRRAVLVQLTPAGAALLRRLSVIHHQELETTAPELVKALRGLSPEVLAS